ncbi:MAG: protocatechuate 4,5-dioxygenase subunit alpha [Sphingomonas hengshuiensis]|uniref:Protocatechuate 4,5-dioxygenase subunit alpha n=1 Tax=Sphingomonas hengshuiensis TaxID=1609977 RepID=A0A2W4YZ61_9SPHN|nr:MAG: protocatechuate 4,5-dioxygenase subunit alpha [Sphingomonas hengshuiensis]
MTAPRDIHAYLAEFDDIPGTRVYTARRARKGYHLNQFAMSLMKADNRARFKADEAAYLDEWKLTPAQREGVLRRDYNALLDEGGNIYFLAKLFSTDGQSFLQAVGTMTGMTTEDYQAMMVAGGRSPEGVRSLRDQAALAAVADAAAEITNTPVPAAEGDR